MRALILAILLATGIAGAAPAQELPPESPPVLDPGAPEGAVSTAHSDRPFDRYALPVGRYAPGAANAREIEGRVIWSGFRLDAPDVSTAEVMEGYRTRLAALGYRPLLDCADAACGGFDFRFAVQLLPPPAMLVDTADFAQLSAGRSADAGADNSAETFVSVLVSRLLGAVYIQTVIVAPADPGLMITPAPPPDAAARPVILAQDEKSLFDRLTEFGHVPVQGLVFETGGAALSEGSAPALDILARFLSRNPELAVVIVGHSDNQGSLDANIALSERRAGAVRAALIERGVAAGRLEAHGVGYLAPVSTNATEAGRTLNRRVELVLRQR
ncbi:MAG: OmpA family protein [Proteobacteria bacterium]|nr:OmpA family protein [Pseudomonadota bacterium]